MALEFYPVIMSSYKVKMERSGCPSTNIADIRNTLATTFGFFILVNQQEGARGSAVVKALRYKPAGGGFDSRWCHWNFSVT